MKIHQRFSIRLFFVAAFFLACLSSAFSQTSPPVLRLETGMHTAVIRHVSVDAAGRFLVTASDDKTARVWDAATGELLRVLRPPIGAGDEGKLNAVAISPDGATIAVGGWTSPSGFDESIYLFDRASGRLVRRISGLPIVVKHLVFAPDGTRLAATLGKGGVRVYNTSSWQLIGVDADYGNQSYGADFDRSGRLVTSCYDGFIRLYVVGTKGLRLLSKQTASGGKLPYSVKFSPDGGKIAVGFNDSTMVNVLSSADARLLFAPDTSGVSDNLTSVAWSATGDTLYAGGEYKVGDNNPIRFWRDGGRGKFAETNAALNTIHHIQPLPNGGVIYGAGDPSWGVIDRSGSRSRFVTSGIADYRAMLENFRVSNNGAELQFFYYDSKSLTRFSLIERRLESASNQNLNSPRTEANNLNITDWENNYEPKLNGKKLNLEQYEFSRSLAVAPDNSKFLLGTEWYLRLFDRTGKELWNVPAPGAAWSVNISGDGRLALAAYADGTIRWYRISDGAELLAFFPHNDKKRWVLWTPSGYYDASPEAEDLIGWHVNNGKEAAADFFPVGLFRNQFYRPDVVSKIIYTSDEAIALRLANEEAGRREQSANVAKQLPPVVEIISPRGETEVSVNQVTIRYTVRSNEPVTNVKALIDGRPIERGVGNRPANASEITVTIPEKDCEISLIAENRFAPSIPAKIRVKWKGKIPAITAENLKPKLYILAVGVSKYADAAFNLGLPSKDAGDFAKVMMRQKNLLYRDVEVRLLTDAQATRDNVVDGLEWITKETTGRDVAMVFMAGHGINDNLNRFYFAPHNFNTESLLRTGVTFSDIKNAVEAIAGKALFFIDSCHSGNSIGTNRRRDGAVDINGIVNELSSAENGAVVFNASTGKQVSLEDAAWGNGAFTKALVEGLSGKAASASGKITFKSLDLYVSERVKQLTGGRQTPTTAVPDTVSDFPIAIRF